MRKKHIIYTFLIFAAFLCFTGQSVFAQVKWMSWEEMLIASKKEPRKVFVDVYTNWCHWCKKMDAHTFRDPAVAEYLNQHFYCVRFNAETPETLYFKGKAYYFNKSAGHHELAARILNNRMSYPSMVFLDEDLQVIQPIPGFKKPEDFQIIISYFATGHYMKTPWAVYKSKFSKPGK
jgi:thioredoxin-related protein